MNIRYIMQIFELVCSISGSIVLVNGLIILYLLVKKQRRCSIPVRASIVNIVCESCYDKTIHALSQRWYPVYEYEVCGGVMQTRANVGGMESDFHIGEQIQLYIDPNNFQSIYISGKRIYMIILMHGVIGLGLVSLAFAIHMMLQTGAI